MPANKHDYCDEDAIRALLIGRTVTKVGDNQLSLDNGTVLRIVPNEGCGGCYAGWYELSELNECPTNAIMAVEFEDEAGVASDIVGGADDPHTYRIFVLAADRRIKLAEVTGDDGNGYYGTGYWIEVNAPVGATS